MNINVLNKNLERVGIVMQYTSLIWCRRYLKNGDCELYLPVSMEMINLLQKDFYLTRDDDDMVCVIRKIEITTDEEQGNMLIVTGLDVRTFLDQRIIVTPYKLTDTSAEAAIRNMITWETNHTGNLVDRYFKKANGTDLTDLHQNTSLTDKITTETVHDTVGNNVRNIQQALGWGGRYYLDNGKLVYESYKGADRSEDVKFYPTVYAMKTSDFVDDLTQMKNITYVATKYTYTDTATGENTMMICVFYGAAAGVDRYEQVSEKNPATMTKSHVESSFPGGTWQTAGGRKIYSIDSWTFVVPTGGMRSWIESTYPGVFTFTTSAGVTTASTEYTTAIAETTATTLEAGTSCNVLPIPMMLYYMGLAAEDQASKGEKFSFTAEVVPDLAYKYKEDYFLGDLVTVENEYGINAVVRVSEVLESWDDTGYNLEIKFNE